MLDNFWLGSCELVIVFRDGRHYVLDSDENYNPVFNGHYNECVEYCKNMVIEYEESIIF